MLARLFAWFEPFVGALLATVLLASLLPPRGTWVPVFDVAANAAIVLLFFLHGAKLSREALLAGARNWRLHLAVMVAVFVLFPLFGLAVSSLPFVAAPIAAGLLFLTLLPSTVQSSIAFTSIAGGNVAAAVCSASFSNMAGIFVTPALVALLMANMVGGQGGVSMEAIETILLQLLVPFAAGHMLRPWIGAFVARNRRMIGLVDRGSILLVVYTAFGAAVVAGLWQQLSASDLGILILICLVLLAVVLMVNWGLGRALGFPREDAIVLLFCGSKKSLATGVPMAGVLFAPAQVGMILLPVMIFHQVQLIACAMIARHYAAQAGPEE
ncbi:MAG: bile acid:sodium symporter [Sphingomonas sp.]|nr:bile acid:sodium symporter [Sphingomonas sp.]